MTGAWRWSLVAVAALGLAAAAAPLLVYWSQLPEPIAVHWAANLRPDGSMAKQAALSAPAALIAAALLLSWIGSARAYAAGRAARVMLVTLVSGIAAAASTTIVTRNLGKAVWTDAEPQTVATLALQIGAPLVLAALAFWIAQRVWRDVQPRTAPRGAALPLAAGARAYWTGGASNRWLLGIGVYLLLQAIVLRALLPQLALLPVWLAVHVVVLAALELFSRIRVTIDGRGVAVRYGHLGAWTRRVPLDRITGAQAVDIDALAHGGWGYRGGLKLLGKASIVVRSGAGLRLDLNGGQQLFITVDDAGTAARLLNALLAREPPEPLRAVEARG